MRPIFAEAHYFNKVLPILTTGLVAIPGGLLFAFLKIPIPWILGPLTVTLIHHALRAEGTHWPVGFRDAALVVLGYSMGRTVNVETTRQILINLPWMAAATFLIGIFSLAIGYFIHRKAGISLASGIMGSMPGGMTQMIPLAEEMEDVDITIVTLIQLMRVLVVLFIVPFVATYGIEHPHAALPLTQASNVHFNLVAILPAILAATLGAWLAILLRFPLPYFLGPTFAIAALVLGGIPVPPVPPLLMTTALIFFGTHMGINISLERLRGAGKVILFAIGCSVALVVFCYLVCLGLTLVTPASRLTAFLSTAPGGMAEMGIVALTLGADVAFILAYQLFRLFCILFLSPLLLKRWFKG
ncbi:MAG: AbrB family transcriptional regulator [Deltaproteobacteria bacterium]|nr:AbrB family transcriptional regulator [Deltaproteobacteria bacterium]